MKFTKKLKTGFWIYFFSFSVAFLGYFLRVLYARSFSLEDFGLIYAVMGLVALISIFNDLGFTETLNYYGTRFYEKKDYASVKGSLYLAFFMQTITAIIIAITLYFVSPWLAENYFNSQSAVTVLNFFLIYFLFLNMTKPLVVLFTFTQNFEVSYFSEFLRAFVIALLSSLILFFDSLSTLKYVAITWGVGYLSLFALYFYARYKFTELFNAKANISLDLYKKLFKYAIFVVFISGANLFLYRIDIFFLTAYTNLKQVGLYTVALSVASIISSFISPLVSVVFPITSKLNVLDDRSKIILMIRRAYDVGMYFSLPILVFIILFSRDLIYLLFGANFMEAYFLLIILASGNFVSMISIFNFNVLSGLGKIKEKAKVLYFAAILNVILNFFLVQSLGSEGVAYSTFLSLFVMFVCGLYLLIDLFGIEIIDGVNLFKILILNIIVGFILHNLRKITFNSLFVEAIFIFICAVGCYIIITLVLGLVKWNDIYEKISKINF